ncbi:hypothetical protein AGIG_G3877 [Arapaima gigas]
MATPFQLLVRSPAVSIAPHPQPPSLLRLIRIASAFKSDSGGGHSEATKERTNAHLQLPKRNDLPQRRGLNLHKFPRSVPRLLSLSLMPHSRAEEAPALPAARPKMDACYCLRDDSRLQSGPLRSHPRLLGNSARNKACADAQKAAEGCAAVSAIAKHRAAALRT